MIGNVDTWPHAANSNGHVGRYADMRLDVSYDVRDVPGGEII